jgi:hypothetical protein
MTLASTSLAQLRYISETTPGVTPSSGNCVNLRLTGESLDFDVQSETSKELRFDRQTTDLVQVGASCGGGFNFELSSREYDPFLQALLQSAWVDYGTGGKGTPLDLNIDPSTNTLTADTDPANQDAFTHLSPGQWIRLNAPGDAADAVFLKVKEVSTSDILIDPTTPLPGDAARDVADCVISASRIANGVDQQYFTLEKEFSDVHQFLAFRGMTPNKMSLSFESGAIVGGNFDFIGFNASQMTETTNLPGVPVPSQTYDVMNAVTGVGYLIEGGEKLLDTFIQSLSLDIDNALRGQTAVGHLGFVGVAAGTMAVTGNMRVYLKNGRAYDKFINNEASSIAWFVRDGVGNGYVFTMPKIKYSGGKVVAGAINQDVLLELPYTALMDGASYKTLFIDRLYA